MYQGHFGFTSPPFRESIDPSRLVVLPSRSSVLRRLRYGLEQVGGPALLFGAPGSGKTSVAAMLARAIGGRSVPLAYPAMPAAELLAFLADELDGLERAGGASAPGLHATLRRLRARLDGPAGRGRSTLLIVDEAHLIDDPSTFEALRLLQNVPTRGPSGLMLLIVGAPEVLLKIPPGLADRLSARIALGPLSDLEAEAYLRGRFEASDVSTPLFEPPQVARLNLLADGLPRRLNRLADLALLIAFDEGLPRPDDRCLDLAALEADPALLAA